MFFKALSKLVGVICVMSVLVALVGCGDNTGNNLTSENDREPVVSEKSVPQVSTEIPDDGTSESTGNDLSPAYVQSEYILPFANLVYCSDFSTPEDIPGYMLLNWYREYINSTKDPNEIKKMYTKEGVDGFIYPALEFESYVKQHFDLTSEYMQSNLTFEYDSTHNGYTILGGGRGEEVELLLDDSASISEMDGVITIQAKLINSENTQKGVKELKIQTMPDGSFKYMSYITLS